MTPDEIETSMEAGRARARAEHVQRDGFGVFAPAGEPQPDSRWNQRARQAEGFARFAPPGWGDAA